MFCGELPGKWEFNSMKHYLLSADHAETYKPILFQFLYNHLKWNNPEIGHTHIIKTQINQ